MDEISVQHIGSLYDYCHSAERFLNDVESAINQMKSDLELLFADSHTYVHKIQDTLESYQSEVDDIKEEIDNLRDQMREEEDPKIRREMLEDIRNYQIDLAEAKEKVRTCKDDTRHANVLRGDIVQHITMIKELLEEFRNSAIIDTEASTNFIRKYVSYLQNATTTT